MAMNFPIRQLPVIQNWSCHQCGNCCREYFVTVTEEEKRRIESQEWHHLPEFAGQPIFVPLGPRRRREWRLAHRHDGSCVFLDEQGWCRIHSKFGEPAKPSACQLYPYMIVPAGNELRVSVRYSCPSAVKNLGRSIKDQVDQIRGHARQLIPSGARPNPPPPLAPRQQLDWKQLFEVVDHLEGMIQGAGVNLPDRMLRAVAFVRLLEEARVAQLSKTDFRELLRIMVDAVAAAADDANDTAPCTGWSLMLFRLMVAQCARKDLSPHLRRGLRGRWALLRAAIRFARGTGSIPVLQPIFGSVPFAAVEKPFGPVTQEAWAILERYYRVKLTGLQFFGQPFYGVPLIEGFYSLSLTLPAIFWIARWLAATAGRMELADDDLVTALTVVDHQWGFSAVFGFGYARRRIRVLARHAQIEPLIRRYTK